MNLVECMNAISRKADNCEVSSLEDRVDTLVNAVKDVSFVCDSILSRLKILEERSTEIK